jgi:hypothetical protein
VTPSPVDPSLFYSGSQGALITRFDRRTGHLRDIQPYPRFFSGEPAASLKERWQWTFPIVFSPHDPRTLYISSQHVWKTTDDGQTWERISPDLTRADPSTLGPTGGPITSDMNGPEIFGTVFALAPSSRERGLIWAGSDDGLVHVTRDEGKTWERVTPPGTPELGRVSMIEASPHRAGTAYVAVKAYLVPPGDRDPHLFRTDDYGRSWTSIGGGIAPGHYVHAIREDPQRARLLYAGTEHGPWVSFDDGGSWERLSLNLPDTQVSDIVVEENDVVVATHGRSIWVLEDVGPLRQREQGQGARPLHLFAPRVATRSVNRAAIDYLLPPDTPKVTVEILDAAFRVVNAFTRTAEEDKKAKEAAAAEEESFGPPPQKPPTLKAGLNRFSWDLRHRGSSTFPGMIIWSARPERGPLALPGSYQVRVTANGVTQTRPLTIRKHPELTVSDADLQKQFDLAVQIRDRTSEANDAVSRIRAVKEQMEDRVQKAKDPRIAADAAALAARLSAVEGEIYQVRNRSSQDPLNFPIKINNRLAALRRSVETGDNPPTAGAYLVFQELSHELDTQLATLKTVLADLAPLNRLLVRRKLPPVTAR